MADQGTVVKMQNPLCRNCQCLDLEQMVNNTRTPTTRIPTMGIEIVDIGKRSTRKRKAACNLCHFFHQLRPNYTKNFTTHFWLFIGIARAYYYDSAHEKHPKYVPKIPRLPFFCILHENARLSDDYNIESEVSSAGVACYIPHESPPAFQLCSVNATSANWNAITHQLDYCSQHHLICQPKEMPSSQLKYIFLIDCATGNIVKGSLSDQFLALSYVWGTQNAQSEFSLADSFFLRSAPPTIQDAIKAVLNLGRRYLWVDRYCIDQQEKSEKKTMIDNMDLIYESSEATLVALYGDNDQSGLPGVSTLSRNTQPIFDTGTGQLIYSFPTITSLIQSSKWNTRGWTYQEARLSRRCLFFSQYQVYLVCRNSTWSEAVPFDPSTNWISKVLNSNILNGALFGVDTHNGWWRDRLEFSKRNLSRETDEMDAFRGILRRSSFITIWGVPVIPEKSDINPNVGFSLGLLWTKRPRRHGTGVQNLPKYNSYRRFGFPTWSWASLHADICQDVFGNHSKYGQYLEGNVVCFPENEANVQFWCIVDGHPISLQNAIIVTNSPLLPEHSRELHVEGDFIKVRRNSKGACNLFGEWRYFEQDLSDKGTVLPGASTEKDVETEIEALILIQWEDAHRRFGTKRFVLMVVDWIDENHAQRVGLLTKYCDEFRCDLIHNLPRVRKRFILQ